MHDQAQESWLEVRSSEKSGSVLRPLQKYCNMPHMYSIKVALDDRRKAGHIQHPKLLKSSWYTWCRPITVQRQSCIVVPQSVVCVGTSKCSDRRIMYAQKLHSQKSLQPWSGKVLKKFAGHKVPGHIPLQSLPCKSRDRNMI